MLALETTGVGTAGTGSTIGTVTMASEITGAGVTTGVGTTATTSMATDSTIPGEARTGHGTEVGTITTMATTRSFWAITIQMVPFMDPEDMGLQIPIIQLV